MGTNYYLHKKPSDACPTCGRSTVVEPLHIGKASVGWVFALRVYPNRGINNLYDWIREWLDPNSTIQDEYDCPIKPWRLLDVIVGRIGSANHTHTMPGAILGPHGLWRSASHCRHGEGTWDYHDEEFS